MSAGAINSLLFNNDHCKVFGFHNKITKINQHCVLCFIIIITVSRLVSSEDKLANYRSFSSICYLHKYLCLSPLCDVDICMRF